MTTTTLDCGCCECKNGACCEGGVCSVKSSCDCAGTFKGEGTTCTPDPCTPDAGACCIGGVCSVQTKAECDAAGGSFLGVGSTCSTDSCLGACCGVDPDGYGCVQTTKKGCADAGGWWFRGEGVPCVSSCPGPAPVVAITISGVKFHQVDPPWKPGVEAEMLGLNRTVTIPLPCTSGRSACPTTGEWGEWRVDELLYMGYPSTGDAAGRNVYLTFYVRQNCSIYLATLGMRIGPGLGLERHMQYASWNLGYVEDENFLDVTPMGPCVKPGDGGGGRPEFVGTMSGGAGDFGYVSPWDFTDVSLAFTYG